MRPPVFSDSQRQLTLSLDEGVLQRFADLRDCVASSIHATGLTRVANELDVSRGNLSVALSADPHRKFGVDELEAYIQKFGDKTPIYYLVAKYLGDEAAARDQALGQVAEMLTHLPAMLAAAGLQVSPAPKKHR